MAKRFFSKQPNDQLDGVPFKDSTEKIYFNLEYAVQHWAWNLLGNNNQNVSFELNWSKTQFKTGKPDFAVDNQLHGRAEHKPNKVLFHKKKSINRSNTEQQFSFQVEGETKSVATVNLKAMLPINPSANDNFIAVKLPSDVLRAGFGGYLQVSNASQTFYETLKWSANHPLKVPPMHEGEAGMFITEKEYDRKFELRTTISGNVLVNVYKDGKFQRVLSGDVGNVWDFTKHLFFWEGLKIEKINDKKLQFTTEGHATFVFGVDQEVTFSTAPIESEEEDLKYTSLWRS